ncbi:MAG: TatD family hydrolase [Oscillatoriales cyanobacterium SM2_2_1]|nr:TatD family hydrolase [Oscillatoriales cyanobacterium SM2_2_1]
MKTPSPRSHSLIDTHVHINFPEFEPDLDQIRDHWRAAGVVDLVHSCVTPQEFPRLQQIATQFREVHLAIGMHPLDSRTNTSGWDGAIAAQIQAIARSESKIVAIGETGLDFYKSDNRSAQIEAFRAQLTIAHEQNLPVIIHSREAAIATREVLQQFNCDYPHRPVCGVMHCWSGTAEETQWFLDLGLYISFSGIITFKNVHTLHEAARLVPGDRLLVETDCPFLAPVPRRGQRNEPAYVRYVAEKLAEIRQEPFENLAATTTTNARRLFNLPQSEL